MFENRVLRRILGRRGGGEVTGGFRKLHEEEFLVLLAK
jgi:hypothetical protein